MWAGESLGCFRKMEDLTGELSMVIVAFLSGTVGFAGEWWLVFTEAENETRGVSGQCGLGPNPLAERIEATDPWDGATQHTDHAWLSGSLGFPLQPEEEAHGLQPSRHPSSWAVFSPYISQQHNLQEPEPVLPWPTPSTSPGKERTWARVK